MDLARRSDGQAMLEQVERANLFLVPLDEVRGWWRYHQLFADLLRARLRQHDPDRVPQLHRAAAGWFERHGLADDAVRHALATGDTDWAVRLVERHADELLLWGEGATLSRWLGSLPADLIGGRPRMLLAEARLALLSGRVDGAEDLLDAAERAAADGGGMDDEPYEPSVDRAASLLANLPATIALDRTYLAELRGDGEGAVAFARRALDSIGQDEWMLASHAKGYLGVAQWLCGRLGDAERLLSSTMSQWRSAGERSVAVRGCHHLGQIQRAQGRLDAALEQVTEGIALGRQLAYTQPLANGLATLAWIRQAEGDTERALDAIGEAEHVAPGLGMTTLLNPVPAQRARLLLAQGELAAAARWTQERGLSPDDEPSHQQEPAYLVLARVLLADDRPDQALRLLMQLHTVASAQGRMGSVIELRMLQALALAATGDDASARSALAEALTLACPQGYVRVFADEHAPMGALLSRLIAAQRTEPTAAGVSLDCLARVLRAFDAPHAMSDLGRGAAAAIPGLIDPLTARELEVLQLLAMGKQNQQIAEELVVTLDTVKKHISHVLAKVGATNRTEAVARDVSSAFSANPVGLPIATALSWLPRLARGLLHGAMNHPLKLWRIQRG